MIKAVIIDLDDTLCMTEEASFEIENEALAKIGSPTMSREEHLRTWGKPLFEVIEIRAPGVDVAAFTKAYGLVIAEFIETGRLDSIPEENYRAMDKLIAMNKTLIVLTSRTHTELRHLLASDHLLAERVKAFYYRDNMQYHKPDPRAFNKLLTDHKLQPAQCVYVGDSVTDAEASTKAGIHFIASLESGLRKRDDFDGYNVDMFIDNFPDIVEAIQQLDAHH